MEASHRADELLLAQAAQVRATHMFIHIPKTGGSSIEATIQPNLTVLMQVTDCCNWWRDWATERDKRAGLKKHCCQPGSPWHVAPDILPTYLNRTVYAPASTPRWCIVRRPADRWESCQAFTHVQGGPRGNWFGREPTPPSSLPRIYTRGRRHLPWTEELLHKQPQHFFIWDGNGRVQCQCVVAFERLPMFTHQHLRQTSQKQNMSLLPFDANISRLYATDERLWTLASQAPELCYRPPNRSVFHRTAPH